MSLRGSFTLQPAELNKQLVISNGQLQLILLIGDCPYFTLKMYSTIIFAWTYLNVFGGHFIHYWFICHTWMAFSSNSFSRDQPCTDAERHHYSNHNSLVKRDNQRFCRYPIQRHHLGAYLSYTTPLSTYIQRPWRNSRPGGCWAYAGVDDLVTTQRISYCKEGMAFPSSVLAKYNADRKWRNTHSQAYGGCQGHIDTQSIRPASVSGAPLWRCNRGHSSTGIVPSLIWGLVHFVCPCSCQVEIPPLPLPPHPY